MPKIASIESVIKIAFHDNSGAYKWVNAFVLRMIKKHLARPKSIQQLVLLTKLPERTLRYNIHILEDKNHVGEKRCNWRHKEENILSEDKRRR